MAASSVLVSVDEYLRSSYRPDRDYVDGELLERNTGEKPHSRLQKLLLRMLESYEQALSVEVLPEQRLQINSSRFRVPDLMVTTSNDAEPRIVKEPPLLCIEILSSEDRMSAMEERVRDYASLGVPTSWVLDPWRSLAYQAEPSCVLQPENTSLVAAAGAIVIAVDDLFAELERLSLRPQAPPAP